MGELEALPRLDSFTKEEWYDIALMAKPEITDEEYDLLWDEFMEWKSKRARQ